MSRISESAAYQRGLRAAITWLHEEARSMNDPRAKAVLNSAALGLGTAKLVETRPPQTPARAPG